MVEEIAPSLYRILIPLPAALLSSVNVYVIKGPGRSLIVDTGMNLDLCMEAMEASLCEINVDAGESDFFITHSHPDHFALVPRLLGERSVVYIEKREAEAFKRVRSGAIFAEFRTFARLTGFPHGDLKKILPSDVTQPWDAEEVWPFRFVVDGDTLTAGDYRFRCITTPGHSPGHTCLYEAEKHLLLAGDHLLWDITPGVQARSDTADPLKRYLESLERIYPMDVRLVLPGHREPFTRFRERIDEIREHHRLRAAEIMAELKNGPRGVYEVASAITWSVADSDSWGSVPDLQKLLATGEAFAHLKYLEGTSAVRSEVQSGRILYSLAWT